MTPRRLALALLAVPLVAAPLALGAEAAGSKSSTALEPAHEAKLARGKYMVTIGGCNDCHTPWKMGANGPEMDMTRMLSGHPQELVMPAPPAMSEPWIGAVGATNTAHAGPWGVSFTANLTPDPETGTGNWSEQEFIDTIRSGRHLGRGRQILPPMPWFNYAEATDEDLSAIYAYLRTIPAIKNKVPDPVPPAATPAH